MSIGDTSETTLPEVSEPAGQGEPLRDFELPPPSPETRAAAPENAEVLRDVHVIDHITWPELAVGMACLAVWFALFLGGSLIDTAPYREQLPLGFKSWAVAGAFWMITNVGLLTCFAAMLGAVGRRTRFTTRVVIRNEATLVSEPHKDVFIYYSSALMRGFGIYMLVFAGLLVLATDTLEAPTQSKYLKLAATLSVMGFYGGYDPETFGTLLARVRRMFHNE